MGREKKSVVLIDIITGEQKSYESINSLARELGVSDKYIYNYIKMKSIFRKKYYIFLKENVPNVEDIIPYYYENVKINMYTTNGKYVKTFDNLKDIKDYLVDKCCNGILYKFDRDCYNRIIKAINKDDRRIYNYMLRSFKNNESCEDIEPYKHPTVTGMSEPVILMDIYTKEQKSYESMSSLAREFGVTHANISNYVRKKYIYKKRYYIFLENDPTPNVEDIISNYLKDHPVPPEEEEVPYYYENVKINMYTTNGKYVKTFDNLKDIKDYLVDKCCNGILYNFSYNKLFNTIDKDNKSIRGYMFRYFENNEDCKDIEPYKTKKNNKEVILMDINTKNQTTYESMSSLAKKFGVATSTIRNYIKRKAIFRKKYRIFLK